MGTRLSPTALHVQYDDHLVNVLHWEKHRNGPQESATEPRQGGDDITTKTAHLAMHNHGHVNHVEELQATTSLHEHRDVHQHQHKPSSALPRRVPLGGVRARAVPPRAERRIREQRPDLTRCRRPPKCEGHKRTTWMS